MKNRSAMNNKLNAGHWIGFFFIHVNVCSNRKNGSKTPNDNKKYGI